MDNIYIRHENDDKFCVTLIDKSNGRSEYQDYVDYVTLDIMLRAEYVTLRSTTIKKASTRVDEVGNVYFYGGLVDDRVI